MSELGFLFEDVDEGERRTRLRVMHALIALYCGWEHPAKLALDAVVFDDAPPDEAVKAVAELPAKARRRVLSAYGALTIKAW